MYIYIYTLSSNTMIYIYIYICMYKHVFGSQGAAGCKHALKRASRSSFGKLNFEASRVIKNKHLAVLDFLKRF